MDANGRRHKQWIRCKTWLLDRRAVLRSSKDARNLLPGETMPCILSSRLSRKRYIPSHPFLMQKRNAKLFWRHDSVDTTNKAWLPFRLMHNAWHVFWTFSSNTSFRSSWQSTGFAENWKYRSVFRTVPWQVQKGSQNNHFLWHSYWNYQSRCYVLTVTLLS